MPDLPDVPTPCSSEDDDDDTPVKVPRFVIRPPRENKKDDGDGDSLFDRALVLPAPLRLPPPPPPTQSSKNRWRRWRPTPPIQENGANVDQVF